MINFTQVCGIDVSKDTLDYCLIPSSPNEPISDCFSNDSTSIRAQFSGSAFDSTLFVVEPTGNYSAKLLHELSQMGRHISLVSPYQSKSYMTFLGQTNKTDKQAAYALGMMGRNNVHLRPYRAPSEQMQKRRQILSAVKALEKQQRMLKNQLHALAELPLIEQTTKMALETVLETVQEQIDQLQAQLYQPDQDPQFNQKMKWATSVKGIGPVIATNILIASNGLQDFDNADQLSKFFGLTPFSHHSGISIHQKGRITKFGNSNVRSSLYMGARSAIKYNHACKNLYERMRRNGKPHKVAMVAVMHKLVKQVFACVTKETLFDNDFETKIKKKD